MPYTYTDVIDATVKLLKGGSVVGDNKADAVTKWPSSDADKAYGGSADLWGTTITPAEVNASDFGAVVSATVAGGTARIDQMRMTVFFSLPAATDTPSYLAAMRIDGARTTTTPWIYALPRAGLHVANDPNLSRATSAAAYWQTSRYYRPSRFVDKTWVGVEFYAELSPQSNTPGIQVFGIVEDGALVQLLDADGAAATFYTSGHKRVFWPKGTTGRWAAVRFSVPASSGAEQPVAAAVNEVRILAALEPRPRNRILMSLVLGPGEFPDIASMRRTVATQKADLAALYGQVVPYSAPTGESGYAQVSKVDFEEVLLRESSTWTCRARVEMVEQLYA